MGLRSLGRKALVIVLLIIAAMTGQLIADIVSRDMQPPTPNRVSIALIGTAQAYEADYTCDGVDDYVEWQAAVDALVNGGQIDDLCGTVYDFTGGSVTCGSDINVRGRGNATFFLTQKPNQVVWNDGGHTCIFEHFSSNGNITAGATSCIENCWLNNVFVNTCSNLAGCPCGNLTSLCGDTSPQLCADLDLNGYRITEAGSSGSYIKAYPTAEDWQIIAKDGYGNFGGQQATGLLVNQEATGELTAQQIDPAEGSLAWLLAAASGGVAQVAVLYTPAGGDPSIGADAEPILAWAEIARTWNFQDEDIDTGGDIVVGGTVDGRDVSVDGAKLDGIEAGAEISSGWKLVAEEAVAANCTAISWDGLDLDSAKVYDFYIALENGNATADCIYYMYFNDDETGAHYQAREFRIYSTNSIARNNYNNSIIAWNKADYSGFWHCRIMRGDGAIYVYSSGIRSIAATTINERFDFTGGWEQSSATNVTKIKIAASVPNGIGAGSKIQIFEVED